MESLLEAKKSLLTFFSHCHNFRILSFSNRTSRTIKKSAHQLLDLFSLLCRRICSPIVCILHQRLALFRLGDICSCGNFPYYLIVSIKLFMGRRGRDHMVVGFTTTCAITQWLLPLKL